jgi:hypothetical protein
MLHHDNAPSDTSVLTQQCLAINTIAVIPHPPYTPELASCDFLLFPKQKFKLKGRRFDTIEEIQAESQSVFDTDRKGILGSVAKMEEGTTSRLTSADRPYGEFYDFCSVSPENFGSTHLYFYCLFSCLLQV